jgi:hypothetical protein
MIGARRGLTRQRRRATLLTARASGAIPRDRADASDRRLDSRLARAHARAGDVKPVCRPTRQGVAPPRGEGGLKPWQAHTCYRPCPHAQIFFLSAKPLIIFFEIKQSNGGALSPERQCKSLQALTCAVPGGGCVLDGFPRICFQSQFGQTRGRLNLRRVPDPGPYGSFLREIWKLDTESPPWTRGGLNLSRLVGLGPWPGRTRFREIRNYFFYPPPSNRGAWVTLKNRREIQGGGGSVARHDEEIDVQKSAIQSRY